MLSTEEDIKFRLNGISCKICLLLDVC